MQQRDMTHAWRVHAGHDATTQPAEDTARTIEAAAKKFRRSPLSNASRRELPTNPQTLPRFLDQIRQNLGTTIGAAKKMSLHYTRFGRALSDFVVRTGIQNVAS